MLKLLWFFVWRMVRWGLGLGALLGAAYGAAAMILLALVTVAVDTYLLSSPIAEALLRLILFSAFLGAVFGGLLGAFTGLGLGILDGLVLFALTRVFFQPVPIDAGHYRRLAGWACAYVGALALLPKWTPDDFFFGIVPWGTIAKLSAWEADNNFFSTNNSVDLWTTVIALVVGPVVVAAWGMRFSGRRVADQYVREFEESARSGQALAGSRVEAEQVSRRR